MHNIVIWFNVYSISSYHDFMIISDLSRTYTQDGVCLTESGLCQLQSLSATASRRRKPKPKLKLKIINQNSVAVFQAPVDPLSEHSRDEDMEDNRGTCPLVKSFSFISECFLEGLDCQCWLFFTIFPNVHEFVHFLACFYQFLMSVVETAWHYLFLLHFLVQSKVAMTFYSYYQSRNKSALVW